MNVYVYKFYFKQNYNQGFLTLCDPMDYVWTFLTLCNPMDYIDYRILQARILEWVAFPFSRVSTQPRHRTQVSHIAGGFFTS